MACDDDILNALDSLGHRDLSQEYDQLERFVFQLYKSKYTPKWTSFGGACTCHPRLQSPVDCGWECDTTRHHYAPVRCLNPPAPAAVMNDANVDARGHVAVGITIFHVQKCVYGCVNFSCHDHTNSDDLVMRDMDGDE